MPDPTDLTQALRRRGDAEKKGWWERYLKGAIEFYGTPMAQIRTEVHAWAGGDPEPAEMRNAAFELLAEPIAEQKLAGILVMQEILLPAGELDASRDLPLIAARFDDGSIADWNTTDWLCIRVLGPMIDRGGLPTARLITGWVEAPSLWRRRSAAVAFVPIAGRGDDAFDGVVDNVIDVCARLVGEPERFIQTGIGWVLRDLSDADPDRVYRFLLEHQDPLSREATRMAAARLPDDARAVLGIKGKRRRR